MKLSKIFHYLYLAVMMLPVAVAPIFAIYVRNENYNSNISLDVPQNLVANFNQQLKELNSTNWNTYRSDVAFNNNEITFTATGQYGRFSSPLSLNIGDVYILSFRAKADSTSQTLRIGTTSSINGAIVKTILANERIDDVYGLFQAYFINDYATTYIDFIEMSPDNWKTFNVTDVMCFNLTQMFGVGNEPTLEEFNDLFYEVYYDYTLSKKELIINTSSIQLSDTDIGSQFVYTMYNVTDKYFNFNNFFGLNGVYNWLQLNWFNGNAPLGFTIFWNFFTYWLLASIAWLLFDILNYLPMMIHRWLDKADIS